MFRDELALRGEETLWAVLPYVYARHGLTALPE